jgi:saccharopine dehydrogenase-like NADP-dependent oxidoreductase
MKALLLGMGLQGKAVAHDLEQSSIMNEILACDLDIDALQRYIKGKKFRKTRAKHLNADNGADLARAIEQSGAHIVISMLPVQFGFSIAKAALNAGIHFVSSSYTGEVAELDSTAREKGITILPEMGMDPGIDLVLGRLAIDGLDEVVGLYSYGAGIPESSHADDNPLRYKISWTFDGVLKAYMRDAVVLKNGVVSYISGNRIFEQENVHRADFQGLGRLEAYPNGDAVKFIRVFGLGKNLRHMGRFALRWPGHCRFWSTMAGLGLMDDTSFDPENIPFSPKQFLVAMLSPQLAYDDGERDVVIIRVQAWGKKNGQGKQVTYEVTDQRDLETGLFAMNRTVGYTASIGAQMILSGKITTPGVLSPVKDVPANDFLLELEMRGIKTTHRIEDVDPDQYMPDLLSGTDQEG